MAPLTSPTASFCPAARSAAGRPANEFADALRGAARTASRTPAAVVIWFVAICCRIGNGLASSL